MGQFQNAFPKCDASRCLRGVSCRRGYLLTTSGDLVISKGSSSDKITIRNWQNTGNQLGIVLDGSAAAVDPQIGALFFNGDQRAKIIGQETQLEVTPDKSNYGTYAWSCRL